MIRAKLLTRDIYIYCPPDSVWIVAGFNFPDKAKILFGQFHIIYQIPGQ
jgi:hypothetical protein